MRSALKDPEHKTFLAPYRAISSMQVGIWAASVGPDWAIKNKADCHAVRQGACEQNAARQRILLNKQSQLLVMGRDIFV